MTTNLTLNYKLTIIIPIYNEEDNASALEEKLIGYIKSTKYKVCLLFINDGSSDNSEEKIKGICERNEHCFYLNFTRNNGLSAAIKAGIDAAQSPFVGYIDADLQTDPYEFDLLMPYTTEYPLVTGIRANRKDTAFKKFQSKFANGFRRMMTKDGATDTGCPLKIINSEYAKKIPFFTGMHRFLPALILLQEGGKFKEIPVHHFPRTTGTSKFHIWNRLKGPFEDCFVYRWMKHRYIDYKIKDVNFIK